jgi:hypothetical protein
MPPGGSAVLEGRLLSNADAGRTSVGVLKISGVDYSRHRESVRHPM